MNGVGIRKLAREKKGEGSWREKGREGKKRGGTESELTIDKREREE